MIKRYLFSFFNTTIYFWYGVSFFLITYFFNYTPTINFNFNLAAITIIFIGVLPIVRWIIAYNKRFFLNSHFNPLMLTIILPFFILISIFFVDEDIKDIIFLMSIISFFTASVIIFFIKLMISAQEGVSGFFNIYTIDWESKKIILNNVVDDYLLFDTRLSHCGIFNLFLKNDMITFDSYSLKFKIKNDWIDYKIIYNFQIECDKKLINFEQENFEILKMMNI